MHVSKHMSSVSFPRDWFTTNGFIDHFDTLDAFRTELQAQIQRYFERFKREWDVHAVELHG